MFRNIDAKAETATDDAAFRDCLRDQLTAECNKKLTEQGRQVTIGIIQYHTMVFQLAWPKPEPVLIEKLISVVDTEYVPYVNKPDPLACLIPRHSFCNC